MWDAEDRLTSATVSSTTTTFAYNGDGLRDSRTQESTTTFTWDVAPSIPQVLDDGSFKYIYGLGRIAEVGPGTTTHYYLPDGLGSTMALTDSSGSVVNTYEYDVFGAIRSSTGSQANEFKFTGEQVDASTGLQYLRARYYDEAIGRFPSKDPMATTPAWTEHWFAYAGADPVNRSDPSGLDDRHDQPEPVPLPPPGTTELFNRCQKGWDYCRDVLAPQERARRLRETGERVPVRWTNDVCRDFFRMCLNMANAGDPNAFFDFPGARRRMQSLIVTGGNPLSDVIRRIRAPFTGSGGLVGSRSVKEGTLQCTR